MPFLMSSMCTSEENPASPFMNISCVINGQFRLLRHYTKKGGVKMSRYFYATKAPILQMMASFLLHWSLEFLLENWTYVKETCIAKIASQNSIFQLLNNVKTARERFYDLQKGRILPENYEPLRQDVKKRRGRYRVIHMTRAANKALGHNRINLLEGLKQLQKSLENIKLEETSRTLKLENQGWKKTSSSI